MQSCTSVQKSQLISTITYTKLRISFWILENYNLTNSGQLLYLWAEFKKLYGWMRDFQSRACMEISHILKHYLFIQKNQKRQKKIKISIQTLLIYADKTSQQIKIDKHISQSEYFKNMDTSAPNAVDHGGFSQPTSGSANGSLSPSRRGDGLTVTAIPLSRKPKGFGQSRKSTGIHQRNARHRRLLRPATKPTGSYSSPGLLLNATD